MGIDAPTIVLVTQAHGEPKPAELHEAAAGRPHVRKVIYLHSRTGAWVHTRRIQPVDPADVDDPEGPMTRLARSDGTLPVLSRDGAWSYVWDADREPGARAVATRVATGEPAYFVDFDSARRWTYRRSQQLATASVNREGE